MVKQQLEQDLKKAVESLGFKSSDIVCSIPQNETFGDYTSNIALQLSKQKSGEGKQNPLEIANKILSKLGDLIYLSKTEIAAPGFINFFIKPEALTEQVKEISETGKDFGKNEIGQGKKYQVEFVSANPTGPLTLANGRGGALGDTLANILAYSGFDVEREYYVNDTGNQVRLLGESVLARAGKIEPKPEHYQGIYIKELAEKFRDKLNLEPLELGHLLADYLMEAEIKPTLLRFGIKHDEYYSERSLHQKSLVTKTAELLKEKGLAYEKDGALWLRSSDFGDEKDRVLITSEKERGKAEPTYFLADIAYHLEVFQEGFEKKINLWGADHHGYEKRVEAALEALGYGGRLKVIFMQMVKLFREGKEVRMSKRAGTFVTLDELLEQVDRNVARFFFLMYSPDSQINFNLDLAKERSNKNPVFYVQYAHARTANILAKAADSQTSPGKANGVDYGVLKSKEELGLIKALTAFPDLVKEVGENYQVQKLPAYAISLADLFHNFYEKCQVLNAETPELRTARLSLIKAVKIVLGNVLGLMGIEAPERM
ncbi:MAG: arginine--tRNA ligase [bacterium]|nr:arginine--tRNA ligase [bacterium]